MTEPSAKILVVDDEPHIRDLLSTSLRFAGFDVRAVGAGAAAISAVLDDEPDLILLDVMLPDISGFGVTKRRRLRHEALLARRDHRAHQGDPSPHDGRDR